jgi:hypothetical protein
MAKRGASAAGFGTFPAVFVVVLFTFRRAGFANTGAKTTEGYGAIASEAHQLSSR